MKPPPESHLKIRNITFALEMPRIAIRCTAAVLPAAHAFQQNIRRNIALGELGARIAGWSSVNQHAENIAKVEAKLPLSPLAHTLTDPGGYVPVTPEYAEAYKRVWQRFGDDPHFTTDYIKQIGLYRLNVLIASNPALLENGLGAVLQAMILGAWTAFETLTGDLFDAALANGPKEWKVPRAIARRRNFQSFKEIKLGYNEVFGDGSQSIFARYPRLSMLKVVRNLYAHAGGKVNARFKSQVSHDAAFSAASLGSLLKLDGTVTKDLFECAARCGADLLHMVDSRLADVLLPQPTKQEAEILEQVRAATGVQGDER